MSTALSPQLGTGIAHGLLVSSLVSHVSKAAPKPKAAAEVIPSHFGLYLQTWNYRKGAGNSPNSYKDTIQAQGQSNLNSEVLLNSQIEILCTYTWE